MCQFDVRYVVKDRADFVGDLQYVTGGYIQKISSSLSINYLIYQGQAIRSIFGRSLVIHFIIHLTASEFSGSDR